MRTTKTGLLVLVGVAFLASGCGDDTPTTPSAPAAPIPQPQAASIAAQDDRTEFQLEMERAIAERAANGLPVPTVTFEHETEAAAPLGVLQQRGVRIGEDLHVVATTVVRFGDPTQAGLTEWPSVEVVDTRPDRSVGVVNPGDYSQAIREAVARRDPGFWTRHEFGQEPRTYTFVEEYRISAAEVPQQSLFGVQADALAVADADIVTGFSVPGPKLDHTINFGVTVDTDLGDVEVIDFTAGFRLDWALGLRLPMNARATSMAPVLEGSLFAPASNVMGVNWSAADYTAAGIIPELGNEFLMRFEFLLGIFLTVVGEDVINVGPNIDIDESSSFTTPFGPGAVFDLPTIDAPIFGRSFGPASVTIGFAVTPQAGSDRVTAAWQAGGEASGGGSLTYTDPATAVLLSSVTALDGPGEADITLRDFNYVFTRFLIDLGLFLQLDVDVPVFDDVSERFTLPVTDFDLSGLFPDLNAPLHAGSSPTTIGTSVTILNVAPTAVIDRTGSRTIQGASTFLASAGSPLTLSGTATDPGRDDLTLTWDFGDGPPEPDVSTTYPVPHEVTELQMVTYPGACVFPVSFAAEDDDAAFGQDQVTVLATAAGPNRSRGRDDWQLQFENALAVVAAVAYNGDNGDDELNVDAATLECYVRIAGHMSAVFDEARDASTLIAAAAVLAEATDDRGALLAARHVLDGQILVAWLNFANGAYGLDRLFDLDGDGTAEASLAEAMAEAEGVRLDPTSTRAEIREQTARLRLRVNHPESGRVRPIRRLPSGSSG